MPKSIGFFQAVHESVRHVPSGRVVSYGQVAAWLGRPMDARAVGYALRALPRHTDVPWWRVVNQQGRISPRGIGGSEPQHQRELLEAEGVVFSHDGTIEMRTYRWEPVW